MLEPGENLLLRFTNHGACFATPNLDQTASAIESQQTLYFLLFFGQTSVPIGVELAPEISLICPRFRIADQTISIT
jgi:hypothetical protein